MPAIDYTTIKGRVARTKTTLSALSVPVGAYCVVLGYQDGMYADGTPSLSGGGPLRPGGSKCMKVVFFATHVAAWAESGFVCAGEPAGEKEQADARRNTSIVGKVLQLTAGQMGRLGVGAVEGERNSIPVPQAAPVAAPLAAIPDDALETYNDIAHSKPLLEGSVVVQFPMAIDGHATLCWHATVVEDDRVQVKIQLRADRYGPVVREFQIPQLAAISQFGFTYTKVDPLDLRVIIKSHFPATHKWGAYIEHALSWDDRLDMRPIIELGALLGVIRKPDISGFTGVGAIDDWANTHRQAFLDEFLPRIEARLAMTLSTESVFQSIL